jgi:hypothetical protein
VTVGAIGVDDRRLKASAQANVDISRMLDHATVTFMAACSVLELHELMADVPSAVADRRATAARGRLGLVLRRCTRFTMKAGESAAA